MTAAPPPFSASFLALFASSFMEAQRRQNRHLKISGKYQSADGGTWQVSLPERLFGLSGLGLFAFDYFATSAGGDMLFVDANHPMVTHGRVKAPDADAAISQLRLQFPDTPEFHGSRMEDADDTLMHGVCSIAAVATNALFYYRCPNNAIPGAALWVLIKHAVAIPPPTLPSNLAALAPPRADFSSYDAIMTAFDAARPAGQAVRLNEFRINFMSMLSVAFPPGVTAKDLFVGFLRRNGYGVRETPHAQVTDSEDSLVDVVAEIVDGTVATPSLTGTFDAMGRMRTINMAISAEAYATDDYPL